MYMKVTAKSNALQRAADFHVILPFHDGYPDAPRPYPTLVFLPGYSGSAEEIIFALPLRQMSALYGIGIIVPDGENAFYTDHPERALCMGQYAGDELLRNSRRLFPCLSASREQTFIGGISMGGYGAAALGLHYSETFSKIVLFSPSAEPDRLLSAAKEDVPGAVPASLFDTLLGGSRAYAGSPRLNPAKAVEQYVAEGKPLPEFWMCCGKQDQLVGDACSRFRETLLRAGARLSWEDGPGDHNLMYWDAHLESAFRFLAGR
ncbi:MAG: hypothetical protein IJG94_06805 [Clostridia bacterium]|nr:hypothetical protein [Clostridia bacterium]